MRYKIGVDIGTTSTKAILFDEHNNIQTLANVAYPTLRPLPDYAEQIPEDIYLAFKQAIRQLTSQLSTEDEITFLSFSSAMHGLIAMDKNGEPLTNAIIWSDNRAKKQVAQLKQTDDWLTYYQRTGTPVHPMTPLAKLLWLKEETNVVEKTDKFIGIKEYIFFKLTGKYVVDYSIASATGLFNIHELDWDEGILSRIGIKKKQLSQPVDVTSILYLEDPAELGLSSQTKLVIGASDGCLANLGSNANEKGEVALSIGTSGALRMTVNEPLLDAQGRTFCYYLSPGKWIIGGAVNNGGNVIQWLDELLYEERNKIYQEMPQAVRHTSPGADGLFFFPYINGERAPFWDGSLRGTYHGMSAYHNKAHLISATLEGILYNLKEVLEIVEQLGGTATSIKASGGFLQSVEWSQLAADIFGIPLTVLESQESCSLGAILLVERKEAFETITFIPPNIERQFAYKRLYKKYRTYRDKVLALNLEN